MKKVKDVKVIEKRGKKIVLWACIGAGLVIIVLAIVLFCNNRTIKQESSLITCLNDKNDLLAKLSEQGKKISSLENTVLVLTDSIDLLNAKNELILKICQSGKRATVAKKPTAKKPIVKKPVVKPATQIITISATEPKYEVSVVTADPLAPLRDSNEEILACARVDGSRDKHFPHYAIDRGAIVNNARDNGRYGYNYVLTPVESISGNVPGVTKDGIFFVPVSYLKRYLNMSGESLKYVDLLYKGNWGGARMTLQGGYYVLDSTK